MIHCWGKEDRAIKAQEGIFKIFLILSPSIYPREASDVLLKRHLKATFLFIKKTDVIPERHAT
jgi:hypothetical protein